MAVHNGLPYLHEAVGSILSQTYGGFEFVVVDDASTDGSGEMVHSLDDGRLRVITNKKQLGLSRSLNKGLAAANGKYVARMDHDDISLPQRLAFQLRYMERHSEIDVLGTWARTIGLRPEQTWRYPTGDAEIKAEMLFNSTLVHSSVMLRRRSFAKLGLRYDPKIDRAQDYEFWTRAIEQLRFANLGKVLQRYRIHRAQVGKLEGRQQRTVAAQVRLRQLETLGLHPSTAQFQLHNRISQWEFPNSRAGLWEVESWLLTLRAANQESKSYSLIIFDRVLERRWWVACRRMASTLGGHAWDFYTASVLSKAGSRSYADKAVFWAKAKLGQFRQ